MKRGWLIGLMVWMTVAAAARGQASRPATSENLTPWETTVRDFAGALIRGDKSALTNCLAAKTTFHRFNVQHEQNISDLMTLADSASIISSRAYEKKPTRVAWNLATDVKQYIHTHELPDYICRRLIPQEDNAVRHADAIAVQWFEVNFDLSDADWDNASVGIIALWTSIGKEHALAFVLVRGKCNASGEYRITSVAFGDPLTEQK